MFVAAHDGETVLIILHLRQKCSQDSKATMRNTTPDDKDGKRRQSPNSNRSKWSHMITHFLSSIMVFHHVSFPLRRSHFTSVPLLASSRGDEVPQRCQKLNKGLVTNAVKRIETRQVEHGIYAKFPQKALFLHIVYHRMWLRMWPEVDVKRYYF